MSSDEEHKETIPSDEEEDNKSDSDKDSNSSDEEADGKSDDEGNLKNNRGTSPKINRDNDSSSDKEDNDSDKEESGSDKEEDDSDKESSEKKESDSDKEEKDSDKEESGSDKEESGSDKEENDSDKESSDNDSQTNEKGDLEEAQENLADNLLGNTENKSDEEGSDEKHKSDDEEKNKDDSSMMITEIYNAVKPPKEPKTSTGRRVKQQQEQLPSYTDDEISEQINIMMKEKKLPDESYHQPIRNYISRFQYEAADHGDYKKAEELETYLETLTELLNQDDSEAREKLRKEQVEEKIRKVKERHEAFLEEWNAEKEKKLQEQDQTKKSMEERHQKEIDYFQAECNDQVFIQRYNKPSQSLINLRKAETQLAMAKLFERAKYLKKQADSLQEIETKEAEKKMGDAVMIKYQAISERQEREIECLEQHNQSTLELLDRKKEKEQMAYEKALNNLNLQLEHPANKDKMETIKPQATKRPIRNNLELTKFKSPPTLDIPTIDISKFTKTKRIIKPTKSNNNTTKKREK